MVKDFRRLWQDVTSATDEAGAVRALAEILTEKEGRSFISSLERSDAEFCFDILDRGITGYDLKTRERQAFFVTLRRLAGSHGRLPDSMIIPEKIEIEDKIIASGGFADVRVGRYLGHLVAVKTLRVAPTDNLQKLRKQFCKEVVLWSSLSHPHVLKFRGIYGDMERGQFTTVSEWMAHGGIMNYIEENHVNRLELLHGAAQGLNYLHDVGLVHGDLKGANILMSNDTPPCACLADFGFMTMVLDPSQPMSCSVQLEGGTTMFMPPELLVPSRFGIKNPIPTPEADVYAFGLVIFQVLTGEMPFRGVRATELAFNLVQGLRPDKPANAPTIGFSDSLWTFVQQCWHGDRNSRPRVVEVVKHLAEAAANWHGLMPPFDKTENGACISSETIPYAAMCVEPQSVVLESPANSQTAESSSYLCLQSTVLTEPPQQEPWETVIKPPTEPPVDCWGAMERRSQEPSDDLPEFRHVAQNHWPPPSAIPPPKRISFREFKAKFRQFFGCIEPQSPLRIVYKKSNSGEFSAGIKGVFEDLNDPDIPLPKPSARSNPTGVMDLGGLVLSSNPVPLELVETNDESQAQEFIDRLLDVVCHSAISSMDWPPHGSQADSAIFSSIFSTPQPPLRPNSRMSAHERIITHGTSQTEVVALIREIFTSRDKVKMLGHLRRDHAQTFIDVIDEALDRTDLPTRLRRKCLSALCKMCGRHALLPRSLKIPLCYDRSGTPLCHGGYADVWKGEYQGRQVAVKVLRVYSTSDFEKMTSKFCKEVVTWKNLHHPNVLPLLGVMMENTPPLFAMASEWMENGNINEFIKVHHDANRFELLKDVAKGLIYMHSQMMIHGDLKGANILIDRDCHACLADFGLLTIVSDPTSPTTPSSSITAGTTQWMSPELLDPDHFGVVDSQPTKESDSYALGMVILEVLSSRSPFRGVKDIVVMRMVIEGKRPKRPNGVEGMWFTDDLWQVLTLCWKPQRERRPSIEAILKSLEQVSSTWKPPSLPVDEDVEMEVGEDDWSLTTVGDSSELTPDTPEEDLPKGIRRFENRGPIDPERIRGLVHALGLSGGESNPSAQLATPATDRGDNLKGEGDGGLGTSGLGSKKTGGAKKGLKGLWARWVRTLARAMGLRRRVQSKPKPIHARRKQK